jgi:hypothetical protein
MRKGFISLGDALRAAADLKPGDAETRSLMLEMLGLEERGVAPAQRTIGAWKPSSTESLMAAHRRSEVRASTRFETTAPQPPEQRSPVQRRGSAAVVTRTHEGTGTFSTPSWLNEAGDSLASESNGGPPPPTPALFGRVVRRGILSAVVSTLVPEGDFDLARIMHTLVARRPLARLPRLPIPTLRRGIQILIDRADAMSPFRQDQDDLIVALDDILADDRFEVLYFIGAPLRNVGAGPRSAWQAWKAPAAPTPILVVTDLGIGGSPLDEDRPQQAEWLRFEAAARNHGNLVVALVPYEALRWPPALLRVMSIVHWSERTTVGEIRRAIRDAWRRLR